MKRISLLSIAAVSLLVVLLPAARRPRYGGTLRIETRAVAEATGDPFAGLAFETLVRFDDKGEIQPGLATSWTHDTAHKRWIFTPRSNVTLHNGAPWEPGALSYPDDHPLEYWTRPANAIVVRTPDGQVTGTGPFRIAKWEAGKSAVLAAHEAYWGGRPYLDAVEIQMGRTLRDQALDFDLGKADVVETAPSDARRLRQRGVTVASSRPCELLALVNSIAPGVGEGLSLSIDREAIRNVILQGAGESTGALLPQWLTGYAFLFAPSRDLARARTAGTNASLLFGYDGDDPVMRAIAERIVLNAEEAGMHLRLGDRPAARLIRLRIATPDGNMALSDIAVATATQIPVGDALAIERSLVNSRRLIPLFHLPATYEVSPRVRDFRLGATDRWHLEDVWLAGERP